MPRVFFLLAVLLLWPGWTAGAEPKPAQGPLDRLIQRSGLDAQLLHFEAAMQRGITLAHESQRALPPAELDRMRKAVAHAYAASSLRPALRAELAKRLTAAEIAAALAWLDSPTGRKLTALEEQAATVEAQQRLESAAQRGIPALAEARAKTLHSLVEATRADEVGVAVLIETAIGINEGLALFGIENPNVSLADLRSELEKERARLVSELRQQTFTAFALVYAEASDAELAALLAFARSPAGVRYHDGTSRAFANTLAQAAKRLGGALAAPAAPDSI